VNFGHIQQWSAQLSLWIAEHPEKIMPILNETLMDEAARKFEVYRTLLDSDENELRVAVHSFYVREHIRELNTRHLNKLVSVNGVVTKRSKVFNEVKRLYLRCAKCNFPSGPFDVAADKDLKPGACIECQSKGPWRVDRQSTLYRNHQKVTIQESPSTVEPGKMPRSKDVILSGDMVDSVRPGDELQLTGTYTCLYDSTMNARTCFPVFKTQIDAVHVHRRGDVKLVEITEDKQQQILELSKDPNIRERFIASMAPSIYGMRHVKTAIATSMMGGQAKITSGKHRIRGDINALIVGDPGLAKSQFLKYVEQTFPRAVYTTGKGASAVGLTAAVTRDEHGDFCLEGGAMVLADDGMCLIDEFDKMNDNDRTSLHEAMEQQTISISKAGIVATLKARCAVVAVANPTEGRYDSQRTFAQNVNLTDPILSRFDMLCVLRDESDPVQDERLADHVVCSHIRSHTDATADDKKLKPKLAQRAEHVEPIDQDLLKYYIVYARQNVFPSIAGVDMDKIANFYKDIRAEAFRSGGAPMTARHVDSLVRIAEANARMELRQHVTAKDVDNAIAMMLESFIQSQKHQVAEELRKRFKRYIVQAVPLFDQFVNLLERLFREKMEQMRLAHPGREAPELSEVGVDVEELVRQIELHDLDINEAHSFMGGERFKRAYRVGGEQIFRNL
jgi:DNA replication licensing factor MCM2